jgi:GNAT superfamily N-acetyltransferase
MAKWVIEEANAGHSTGWAALQRGFFAWTLPPDLGADRHPAIAELLFKTADDMKTVNRVATADGRVVGFAAGQPFAREADGVGGGFLNGEMAIVAQVAVNPAWRRKGIGSALMHETNVGLANQGFSVASAHITEALVPWYEELGWSVLPAGHGVAWIETHREGSADVLPPGAPAELKAVHTAGFSMDPAGVADYNILAIKQLGDSGKPVGLLTITSYPPATGDEEKRIIVAKSLIAAIQRDNIMSQIPQQSAMLLALDALTDQEQLNWARGGANK